jgi:hypothetical protein
MSTLAAPQEWELAAVLFVAVTGALMVLGRSVYPLFPGVLLGPLVATLAFAS